MNEHSGVWAGVLTLAAILVGTPLATWIKGRMDRALKKQDVEQADDVQVRADLKSERDLTATLRQEANVLRADADRERTARVDEANANMLRVREILGAVEDQQTQSQRLLDDMDKMRQAHRVEMAQQREAHRIELEDHTQRIVELEQWITDRKPPPAPEWQRRPAR